jgi:zinc protease
MKIKKTLIAFSLLLTTALVLADNPPTQPTPPAAAPTDDGNEMMQNKAEMVGYGAEQYRLVNEKTEIVSVLRNGMTVIVKRVPSPVVAVRGLIGTGGVYEGKWLGGGLSHLLEHLVAGGSNQRRTEAENRNLLQQIGNNSNAYTTEDRTAFFVNTTPQHMEQAVDLVTGWITGAKITVPEYRREYEVVQRELEMGKGEPDRQFYYMSAMNRYKQNPARVPVIGYQEVIQGLSRDDVFSYYKMAYEPHNMIFTVVGDIDPEVMLATVRKYVSDFKPSRVFEHNIAAEPAVLGPRTLVATFPKLGHARLELGFEGVKLTSPDMYALDLPSTLLGGGDSALMVEQMRDEKQLVSEISCNDDTPTYATGTFTIDMQLAPEKVPQATGEALDILESLKTKPVDADRIRRAKTQLKVAHVKSMQTVEDISTGLADDFMSTTDLHFSDRYVERIQAVTATDLMNAAKKYFYKSRLLTTLMLPSEFTGAQGLPKAEELIRPASPTAQPVTAEAASAVRKVELDNGTILLLKRTGTSPLININMYSLGGVTAEDARTNGIGNLAMEMLPRGTTTRDAEQIAEFFDSIGGNIETACGNNSWYWNCSCLKSDFDKTMDVYADVVTHPAFDGKELAMMKTRVDADISSQDADWTAQAMRFYKHEFFGPGNSPYQFMPIGTSENVDKFTADQLRDWYKDKILGGHRVIAIYGDIDLDHTQAIVQKDLGAGPKLAAPAPIATNWPKPAAAAAETPSVDVKAVKVQKTQQALAGIVIGFKSDSITGDPANYILDVGQTMAGGWGYPTGYLFETLRGRGLVYVVQATNNPGRSSQMPGSFYVFAGCDPSKVNEVVDQILLNIARLQGTAADMQEDWFNRSKLLINTADALDNETPAAQASAAALDELFGLGYDYHSQFAPGIDAVTLDQIRATAASRLHDCVVTVSTPDPDALKISTGVRTYDRFPTVDLTPRGVQHATGVVKP